MTIGRILVTGAAGFLGSEIVTQASIAGQPVIATDWLGSAKAIGIPFVSADILDPNSLSKLFKNVDCVCHVAGLAHIFSRSKALTASFHDVNVTGTDNVARAAVRAGVRHIVFVSSVSVYGGDAYGKNEDAECHPEGPYAESKFHAECSLIDLCMTNKINLTILRLATLYGEGDPGNVARLIGTINRRRFIWVGKGDNLKSLLHREDAAKACMTAMNTPVNGINIYNVSAPPVRMRDIVEAIVFASGKPIPTWYIPVPLTLATTRILKYVSLSHGWLGNVHDTLRKWLADDYYNTDKFCKAFNYQTKVGLEEGIQREIGWYNAERCNTL